MDGLISKNVTIDGHRTSLRLETEIWDALSEIHRREGWTVHHICSRVERRRRGHNRTSAVRAYVVSYFLSAATKAEIGPPGLGGIGSRARVSHALRTPLNTILGFSEIILNETFGPIGNTKYQGYIKDIHGSGILLLDVVNSLGSGESPADKRRLS